MNSISSRLYALLKRLASHESGQDLVEYALVVALIAFAATAGMRKVASGVNTAYSNISSQLISAM